MSVACSLRDSHGGKTCAASPQTMTRPSAHRLQHRAAKANGRHRRTSTQSVGYSTSFASLYFKTNKSGSVCVSKNKAEKWRKSSKHSVRWKRKTYPYRAAGCFRYGQTTFLIFEGLAMSRLSSPGSTTNSNLHSRSDGIPKRPHTAGLSGLQRKRKFAGKNALYTSSGEYPSFHKGNSGCVFSVGSETFQFKATHVSL